MTYVDNGTIHPGSQLTALPWPHGLFLFRHVSIHIHRPQQYKGLDCWHFNQPFLPFAWLWGLILGIREASAPFTLSPEGGEQNGTIGSPAPYSHSCFLGSVYISYDAAKQEGNLSDTYLIVGILPLVLSPLLLSFYLMNQLFWQGGERSLPGSLSLGAFIPCLCKVLPNLA